MALHPESASSGLSVSSPLSDAVAAFLHYARVEKGLAKTTLSSYGIWANVFLRWIVDNGYPAPLVRDFNPHVLRRYLAFHAEQKKRPRTIRSAFAPLRGIGNFLVLREVIAENPVRSVQMPKRDAAKRALVSDEEVALLLDACYRQKDSRKVALSRAVLSVLVYGGLRRQELLDLQVGDVNLGEGAILIRSGKERKARKVFVCGEAIDALSAWLCVRPTPCEHTYLWTHGSARRLHENGLVSLLETVKAVAGLKDNDAITPHALRHACATRLLRNGADLGKISAFLGHASIVTTQIYLHTSEEQLRDIADLSSLGRGAAPSPVEKVAAGVTEEDFGPAVIPVGEA